MTNTEDRHADLLVVVVGLVVVPTVSRAIGVVVVVVTPPPGWPGCPPSLLLCSLSLVCRASALSVCPTSVTTQH